MSVNQSRAEKSESGQHRKTNRSGNSSGGQRNFPGGGGKGSGAATAPTPSLSTSRSFKKPSNAQGSQIRVVNSDIRNDATAGGNVAVSGSARGVQNGAHSQSHGGSDAPAVVKQNVTPTPKINRGVPKAPAPNNTPVSSNTMAPSTPVKGGGFPLQFGSISPGLMQVPARTSSAPPNLDEQKREQARYESSRVMPVLPAQSVPKQNVPTNNSATSDQPNIVDTHSMSKARRDVQVAPGPHAIQTQKPSVHPISGMPMQMPFHQQHIPVQFGNPNPQLQSQSMVNSSMPMPMGMPFPMGNPSQVQQQLYIQGLPPHMMPPQGVMHQGQGVNFSSQMGTQLPHMGNMGMNINPQFSQQQPGNFGGARKTVKITHPDTHEELSLSKRTDTYKESGSSAPRSHTNIPPQSQPISSFPPGRPSNFYPNSYSQGSVFYTGPNSLHLSSNQVPPNSQAPRLYKQVTVKPAASPRLEKIAETSLPASSPTVEKNIPKISGQEGEATSIRTERDPEKTSDMSSQKSEYTSIPVQIKGTGGVSDSASASSPLPSSIPCTPPENSEYSTGSSITVVAKNDLLDRSNDNDEKHSKKSQSVLQNQIDRPVAPSLPEVVEDTRSSSIPEAQPGEENVRESETSVAVDLNTNSSEVQGIHELEKSDGVDSAEMSADVSVDNKPKHEAMRTQESRNILLSEPNADAAGCVASAKSDSPRPYEHADQTESLIMEVKDKQLKLEMEPVHLTKGDADADLSTSIVGTVDCLITETSSLSLGSTISHDYDKTSASDASTIIDNTMASTETESNKLDQKSQILSVPSQSEPPCETEIADSDSTELLSSSNDLKDKPVPETIMSKNTNTKKKRREALQKADRAGRIADLYMAYKGPDEKKENPIDVESSETSSSQAKELASGFSPKDVPNESKAEPDDWEDAADLSTPKLDDGKLLGEVKDHIEDKTLMDRKYSRDFLLKFSEQCKDLPVGFKITLDIAEALVLSIGNVPLPSPGRNDDRSMGRSPSGRRGVGMGMGDDDKWSKVPGPLPPGLDMGYGSHANNVFQPGANFGVLRNPRVQSPVMHSSGILSGPVHSMGPQYGMQRTNSDADKWQRATNFQRGLMPSPRTPAQVMHKAERKYEVGKITDEEQAKQRQLKAILNKLTPQNFERLFEQVKQVNIDNAGTLTGVISQIFDKALMEPTFCEMYADFCYHLAGDLPDFNEDNEKITFKRLLLNKCQEEFERGEREQEEANRAEEEGEVKQSDEEREEKRVQARRRMLGNIRLIGELYKKKMLTERIMHECIKKLLGQYQNPDEEDVEALCKLMSTIGEMIDHPKAKEHMDAYFDMMAKLSNNMKLSSRVRFMLKDSMDLRKNKWQQRRKVEGPKKIEEVHRDAANERQAQANRLARGPSMGSSFRRGQQPMDFAPRGSNVLSSPNSHMGGFRGAPQQPRGYATQDIRTDERHPFDNRNLLPQRPLGDSITLVPQGGLARGMSIRGQPPMLSVPFSDMHNQDSRRTTPGLNGYGSVTDRPVYTSREELIPRSAQRFVSPSAHDHMNITDGNSTYMNREMPNPDRVFNRSRPNTPPSRGMESISVGNIPTEKVLPEEQLRKKSLETIKEFYSAKDEMEVALCVKDLNAPSFYPSMISIWITDSFERKDMERGLLAKLLVNLAKSRDTLLSRPQFVEGFESVLACLEDAVTDAPKAPEFLGGIFAKFVLENVLPMAEIGRLIYEGGEQQGQLVEIGLAAEVLGSVLEIIKTEKGEQVLKEICTGSSLRLENFRPPNSKRALTLDKFI
ncbi:eukaryotic translation initiation factor 4G-like [Apium graveolens]|uniref:eukaryotic translation initiation factor 4G-like n=1 Tax=Apium graveolens TaxID=4045 RepID=UPI003D7955C5